MDYTLYIQTLFLRYTRLLRLRLLYWFDAQGNLPRRAAAAFFGPLFSLFALPRIPFVLPPPRGEKAEQLGASGENLVGPVICFLPRAASAASREEKNIPHPQCARARCSDSIFSARARAARQCKFCFGLIFRDALFPPPSRPHFNLRLLLLLLLFRRRDGGSLFWKVFERRQAEPLLVFYARGIGGHWYSFESRARESNRAVCSILAAAIEIWRGLRLVWLIFLGISCVLAWNCQ